jgi:hypothetical protein
MIKADFGDLKVQELSADEVMARFNCLYGSNTRPKITF